MKLIDNQGYQSNLFMTFVIGFQNIVANLQNVEMELFWQGH
jgi:hypothetical protein